MAEQTRGRVEQLPGAVLGELRRRVNVLDLATKQDVAAQSKLGRNRVSFVLREFLEAQRSHDEALAESIRIEVREELQNLVAALDDDLAEIDAQAPPTDPRTQQATTAGLHDLLGDDDEIDSMKAEWTRTVVHDVGDANNAEDSDPHAVEHDLDD